MNYEFRETEARWSDLALVCCDMRAAKELGSGSAWPSRRAAAAAGARSHQVQPQTFMCPDLRVLSSTTLLEAASVVSEVRTQP